VHRADEIGALTDNRDLGDARIGKIDRRHQVGERRRVFCGRA
jgi:hypothetical protein